MLRRLWKFRLLWSSIFVGDVILLWYRAGEAVEATVKSKDGTTLVVSDVNTTVTFPRYAGLRLKGVDTLLTDVSRKGLELAFGSDPSGTDGGAFVEYIEKEGWNIPNCVNFSSDNELRDFLFEWKRDRSSLSKYFSISVCADGSSLPAGGKAYPVADVSVVFLNGNSASVNENVIAHELGHLDGLMEDGSRNLHVDNRIDAPSWDYLTGDSTHCLMSYNRDKSISKEIDMDCIYRIRDASN